MSEELLTKRLEELTAEHVKLIGDYGRLEAVVCKTPAEVHALSRGLSDWGFGAPELKELKDLLVRLDESLWFDASPPDSGACLLCDANLHENSMGKHAQLNGDLCLIQEIHDVVERFR